MIVRFLMLMHRRWQSEFCLCHFSVAIRAIHKCFPFCYFPFQMWNLSFNGSLVHISEFKSCRIPVLLLDKIYFECDKHSQINWFVIWYIFIYIFEAIKCHRPRTCTFYGHIKSATRKKTLWEGKKWTINWRIKW